MEQTMTDLTEDNTQAETLGQTLSELNDRTFSPNSDWLQNSTREQILEVFDQEESITEETLNILLAEWDRYHGTE